MKEISLETYSSFPGSDHKLFSVPHDFFISCLTTLGYTEKEFFECASYNITNYIYDLALSQNKLLGVREAF